MPRDANGNYTLPSGNPVVTQTDISSVWANDTMSDLGTEITDSLSRSGKGGMTGPFPIVDKSGNVPGLSFAAEPTTGILREAAGDMRAQVQGTSKMRWTAAGDAEVWRNSTWQTVATQPSGQKAMTGVGGTSVIYFYNASVPPLEWTLESPDANVRNLTIGGTGGTIGGSDNPISATIPVSVNISGNTANHLLSGNTEPTGTTKTIQAGTGANVVTTDHNHVINFGNHQHGAGTLSGSGSGVFAPRHAMGLLAKLNA